MGFSVFDDVAFYYLTQAVLAVFLVPWSLIKMFSFCCTSLKKPAASGNDYFCASNEEYELRGTKIVDKKTFRQRWLRPGNILFLVLWVVFLYQCLQLPHYLSQELSVTWDPVDILEVPSDAGDADIKAAYKRLSLIWHPDKHPPEMKEIAQQKFIEIANAYKSLTDPKAKANMRKYGNIDGTQGNMTIGLPSFLTLKENNMRVLLIYFLLIIMTPPISVFWWWNRAAGTHESGISRETITNYWHIVTEHMSPKTLIAIMCCASEFKSIGTRDNSQATEAERKKLKVQVQEYMVKTVASRFEYADRSHVLALAHLMRIPIPECLQPDVTLILRESHKLLGAMFSICLGRKFVKASMGCVELMQMMTQAMAPFASPLLQVPYLTSREIRLAQKKKMDTLETFRQADDEKRMKVYAGHSDAEWKKIKEVCERIPDIAMDCQTLVEGEVGIFEGDIVTVRVTLERIKAGATKKTQSQKVAVAEADEDAAKPAAEASEEVDDSVVADDAPVADDILDEDGSVVDEKERKLLDTLPVAKAPPSKFGKDNQQTFVHSAFYPYPKAEKWVLFLFQKTKNKTPQLAAIQKVPDFLEKEVVEIRMRVGEKGVWPYELHAKCDSYVGCDVSLSFKITVNKFSKAEEDRREARIQKSKEMGLDDDADAEEQQYKGQWYYAGFASFWELALNLGMLFMLGWFVINFLQQRGYWQHLDPVFAKIWVVISPVYDGVAPLLRPVLVPIFSSLETAITALGNITTVDPDELVKAKEL